MSVASVLERSGNVRDMDYIFPIPLEIPFDPRTEIDPEIKDEFIENRSLNMLHFPSYLEYQFLSFLLLNPDYELSESVRNYVVNNLSKSESHIGVASAVGKYVGANMVNGDYKKRLNIQDYFLSTVFSDFDSKITNDELLKIYENIFAMKGAGMESVELHPSFYKALGYIKLINPNTYKKIFIQNGIILDKQFWSEAYKVLDRNENDVNGPGQNYWQMAFGMAALSSTGYRIRDDGKFELLFEPPSSDLIISTLPEIGRFEG